jgi:hypothetical protein
MSERRRTRRDPTLIDEYIEFFSGYSAHNIMYARLSFHVLLGQLTNYIKIRIMRGYDDNRISLMYLAPSGTGKSVASDVYGAISEHLEFNTVEVDDYSDRSVVGTVKEDEGGEMVVHKGFLETADIVHADEAEVLFLPSRYAPRTKTFIQKSLNAIGSRSNKVTRQVGGESVEVTPTCSYIFTSFPPEDDKAVSDMINNGILQRTAFFPRLMTDTDWVTMSDTVIDGIVNPDADINYNITAKGIAGKLDQLRQKYNELAFEHIPVETNLGVYLKNCRNWMIEFIKKHNGANVVGDSKMKTYITRYIILMTKFATHYAMVIGRTTVDRECMEYGWSIIQVLFRDAYEWVDSKTSQDRKFTKFTPHEYIYQAWKRVSLTIYDGVTEGFISRSDLKYMAVLISKRSEGWFNQHLSDLVTSQDILSERVGRNKYYKVQEPMLNRLEDTENVEQERGQRTNRRQRRRQTQRN